MPDWQIKLHKRNSEQQETGNCSEIHPAGPGKDHIRNNEKRIQPVSEKVFIQRGRLKRGYFILYTCLREPSVALTKTTDGSLLLKHQKEQQHE